MEKITNDTKVTKDGEIVKSTKKRIFIKQLQNIGIKYAGTPTGNGYEIVDNVKEDPATGEVIHQVEQVHLWALIQENEGSCSLDFILGEMAKGNMDVLNKTDGKFMDTTKLPKNIYELQEFEKKTLEFYNKNDYIKRLYKTPGDYRKALTANVDIEKQIIDLYRDDVLKLKVAQAGKNGADAPKGDK